MLDMRVKTLIDFTLGDGSIVYRYKGSKYPSLSIGHGEDQFDYIRHKAQVLEELGLVGKIYTYENKGYASRKQYKYILSANEFCHTAHKYVYNKKRKSIDRNLLRQLDERSLAYWFMDDGGASTALRYHNNKFWYTYESRFIRSFTFANCSFTMDENRCIAAWMLDRWGIVARTIANAGNPILSIGATASKQKLIDAIYPYLIPSMQYKIQYPISCRGIAYTKEVYTKQLR